MLSRIIRGINKKRIGAVLVGISSVLLIGMAGADDISALQGVHTPILPLLLKGIGCLAMMTLGVVLIGGGADEDTL